ncbi:MAG: hypothetical protein IPG01_13335 [Chitinophagaceae bacterium]|nr:hypothetical protein [Chitinophagaceae bacterium]
MRIISTLFIILLSFSCIVKAQNLVAVHHLGQPSFYTQVTDAVSNSQSGDTIYIPGGSYSIGTLEIDKELHIYGVGHNPDSSKATGFTLLTGFIVLTEGSDNTEIIGLKLGISGIGGGTIYFGNIASTNFISVSNCQIRRCYISSINFRTDDVSVKFSNNTISENVIFGNIETSGYAPGVENNFFTNNILGHLTTIGSGNLIQNNVFLTGYVYGVIQSTIENNVFLLNGCCDGGQNLNNIIRNNLCGFGSGFFTSSTNIIQDNIYNQVSGSIFINQSGSIYQYTQNYHLQITSPGKNAGADGTDVGVYGGIYPWKEGSIPPNPHIQSKTISSNTDASGNLPINIKVAAQDH